MIHVIIWFQFEEGILEAALYLMRKGFKVTNSRAMSNPVKVARVVAKMVGNRLGVLLMIKHNTNAFYFLHLLIHQSN